MHLQSPRGTEYTTTGIKMGIPHKVNAGEFVFLFFFVFLMLVRFYVCEVEAW